ncbi:hypothetical protein JCM11754A_13560 [Isoptericola variabilis]
MTFCLVTDDVQYGRAADAGAAATTVRPTVADRATTAPSIAAQNRDGRRAAGCAADMVPRFMERHGRELPGTTLGAARAPAGDRLEVPLRFPTTRPTLTP